MSVMSELEKRLTENEKRIGALLQHLEVHVELEESLRNAGSGLSQANDEVRQLAESARAATQSLADVLAVFREAVEILRRSDPTRTAEAVAEVEERIKSAEQGIRESIGKASGKISLGQEKVAQQLWSTHAHTTEAVARVEEQLKNTEKEIRETIGEAAGEISSAQERIAKQLRADGLSIRKSIPTTIVYITFFLVLVLLGFEILRHFPTLLDG